MDLFGRHPINWQQSTSSAKTFANNAARFGSSWNGCKPKEVPINPNPTGGTFGFYGGFRKGALASTPGKDEKHQRGNWENV